MIKYKISSFIQNLLVVIWLILILLPFSMLFINAFKTKEEFYKTSPIAIPHTLHLDNFKNVFASNDFFISILSTITLILLTVVITTILSSSVAYVLERFDFKYKSFIITVFTLLSLVPMIVMQVFVFQILNKINLYNTFFGIALLYSVSDIVIIYVFRENIRRIPTSIEKSAILQGSSYLRTFLFIILPCLKEAIMTVILLKTIIVYNDFYMQFLYLPTKPTLSTFLYSFVGGYSTVSWPQICATIVLSFAPILLIVVLSQFLLKSKISNIDLK